MGRDAGGRVMQRRARYSVGSELEAVFALQLMTAGIKFRREYQAIPGRKYRWDYAIEPIEETRLLVELNGGTHQHMGHSTGVGIQRDYDKANAAVCHGFRQLTFTAQDVHDLTALDMVCKLLLGTDTAK
ncbi:MAG: hypothetical protein ACYC36_06050 [Bellilinea sp.]